MQKKDIIEAAKSGASFGFEQGYGQALHFIEEFIEQGNDSELKKRAPDMKKHARILIQALSEYAEPAKVLFMERLRYEVVTQEDGSMTVQ